MSKSTRSLFASLFMSYWVGSLGVMLVKGEQPVWAQITPDRSTATEVNGKAIAPVGSGTVSGGNLYHSFDQFNVPTSGVTFGTGNSTVDGGKINNILNRVTSENPSQVLGTIESRTAFPNANLYLMNPNGVVFGKDARLDIGGSFHVNTGTSLGFAGDRSFSADKASLEFPSGNPQNIKFGISEPAAIINQGNLTVDAGKSITFTAGSVINSGILTAPGGNVAVTAVTGGSVVNLRSPDLVLGLSVAKNAVPTNWNGEIATLPKLAELLTGKAIEGDRVVVKPDGTLAIVATSTNDQLPIINGTTVISGTINTSSINTDGGQVGIFGDRVAVVNSQIIATGINGGKVLIGGDLQGNGSVPNAEFTYFDRKSVVDVSALENGDGGLAIVWGDRATQFLGTILSKGGSLSGGGGFVEVSGKENLVFDGNVDVRAINGKVGTLLLDPTDITISTAANTPTLTLGSVFSDAVTTPSNLNVSTLVAQLGLGNVTISTASGLGGLGNITLNSPLTLFSANTLTFQADNDINLNAAITIPGSTNLIFNAGRDFNGVAPTISVRDIAITAATGNITAGIIRTDVSSDPNKNAGSITLSAPNGSITTGDLTARVNLLVAGDAGNGGAIAVTAKGDINTGNLQSSSSVLSGNSGNGENITLLSSEGNISTGFFIASANGNGNAGNISINGLNLAIGGNIDLVSVSGRGGDLTLNGNLGLTTNRTFSTNSGGFSGNIDLSNANITGNQALALNAGTGNISLGAIGTSSVPLTALNLTSGNTTLNKDIYTTNALQFNSPVTLGGNVAITTSAAPTFGNTINGNQALSINAGSNQILFNGIVGGVTPLASLTTNATSIVTSTGDIDIRAVGDITTGQISNFRRNISLITGGNISTSSIGTLASNGTDNGGNVSLITSGGFINNTGVIYTYSAGGNGGNILQQAAGNISIDGIQANGLGLNGKGGNITFITSGGSIFANALIQSVGTISGGNVTIQALGDISISQVDANSPISILSSGGAIETRQVLATYGGDITLQALGNIKTVGVFSNGLTNINGGAISLTSLGGSIDTSLGGVNSSSPSGNGNNVFINAPLGSILTSDIGAYTFSTNPSSTAGNISLNALNIAISGNNSNAATAGKAGNLILSGNIALTATTRFYTNSNGISGNIDLSKANITGNQGLELNAGTGNISLGVIGTSSIPLTVLNLISGSTTLSRDIYTTGAMQFNSPVTLGGNVAIASASNITFNNTVNGNQALSFNVGTRSIFFNSSVGDVTPLASLETNAASTITSTGAIQIKTLGDISTGNITNNGRNVSLITTGTTSGNITVARVNTNSSTTGGDILLQATGNITAKGNISSIANPGNSGKISLISTNGSIDTSLVTVESKSFNGGNSGEVLYQATGDIKANLVDAIVQLGSGNAAKISFISTGGSISTNAVLSISFISGNSGDIFYQALSNIATGTTGISAYNEGTGNGGNISLISTAGSIDTRNSFIYSYGNTGNAGDILFQAAGNITTGTIVSNTPKANGGEFSLISGGSINTSFGQISTGGLDSVDISLQAADSITTGLISSSNAAGSGGDILLQADRSITTTADIRKNVLGENGGKISFVTLAGDIDASLGRIFITTTEKGNSGEIGYQANGNITTGETVTNGSSIFFQSTGNITATKTISSIANPGNSGKISLISTGGNIDTSLVTVESRSLNGGDSGEILYQATGDIKANIVDANVLLGIGNGAKISFITTGGSISTNAVSSVSFLAGNSGDIFYQASGNISTGTSGISTYNSGNGDGGQISMISTAGSIDTQSSFIYSYGNTGNAGNILLQAKGDITIGNTIDSSSATNGKGANISLITSSGSINTTLGFLNSRGNDGLGGDILLQAAGDIATADLSTSSEQGSGKISLITSNGSIDTSLGSVETQINVGNGNGGDILYQTTGNITTGQVLSRIVATPSTGTGGKISFITTGGSIITNGAVYSYSFGTNGGDILYQAVGDIQTPANGVIASGNLNGGNITFTTTGGAIDTSLGQVNSSGDNGGIAGNISFQATGNITTQDLLASTLIGNGGNITLLTQGNVVTGNIDSGANDNAGNIGIATTGLASDITVGFLNSRSFGNGKGGDILVQGQRNITTGDLLSTANDGNGGKISIATTNGSINTILGLLDSSSVSGNGGNIFINAPNGNVVTGDLIAGTTSTNPTSIAGDVTVIAKTQINAGQIVTNAAAGKGGNVLIDPISDVAITAIDTSGNTQGGNVQIVSTGGNIRLTGFVANSLASCTGASICTAGGTGGAIAINHGGLNPFIVGDAALNGSAGIISNGLSNLSLGQIIFNFAGTFRLGNISIAPGGEQTPEPAEPTVTIIPIPNSLFTASPSILAIVTVDGNAILQSLITKNEIYSNEQNALALEQRAQASASLKAGNVEAAISQLESSYVSELQAFTGKPIADTDTPNTSDSPAAASAVNSNTSSTATVSSNTLTNSSTNNLSNSSADSTSNNLANSPSNNLANSSTNSPNNNLSNSSTNSTSNNPANSSTDSPNIPTSTAATANFSSAATSTTSNSSNSSSDASSSDNNGSSDGNQANNTNVNVANTQKELNRVSKLTGSPTAVVYPVMFADRLELMVILPDGKALHKTVTDSPKQAIIPVIKEFRANLIDAGSDDYLIQSQKLHDWLIKPIEEVLETAKISTLIFVMDGDLRVIPSAALHDGKSFLIEKYAIATVPSLKLVKLEERDRVNSRVLAMGLTEARAGFAALPAVNAEIGNIVGIDNAPSLLTGKSFINEPFTLQNMQSQRKLQDYGIIHLATHAKFLSNSAYGTFIQLYNDRLYISDIPSLSFNKPQVEMLTLSACETAVGNNLGLAGLAVTSGVRSVLASLWTVSDAGTVPLMLSFYSRFPTANSKAIALQQAQLSIIRGEVIIENNKIVGIPTLPTINLPADNYVNIKHPFFWSSFVLVGSWL